MRHLLSRMMPRRFATQTVLIVVLAMAAAQAAYMLRAAEVEADRVEESLRAQALALAGNIAVTAAASIVGGEFDKLEQLLSQAIRFPGVQSLQIVAPDGQALADVATAPDGTTSLLFGQRYPPPAKSSGTVVELIEGGTALLLWHPIKTESLIGWVRIGYSLRLASIAREAAWRDNLVTGLIAIALSALLISLYLRRPLRGVRAATSFASRLNDGSGRQIEIEHAAVEFEALAKALNEVSTSLATSRQANATEAAKLAASEARSYSILRTMRDGVVHIDACGIILLVNDGIEEMFGYDQSELTGRNVSVLMPEPHRGRHDDYLARYLATRRATILHRRVELAGQRKDGSTFEMTLAVNELVDDAGSTFIGVINDITEQKEAEQKLMAALDEARRANEAKSTFLANMSHEIRTPINAISGFAHLCLNLELPTRGRDYIQKVQSAADSLLRVVNDILDFSKIEAGKLEFEAVPFSLGERLQKIASLFGGIAKDKGVELVIGALPEVPDMLVGDPVRLNQVITNLIGNALKFTEQGEVTLTVRPLHKTPDKVCLRFEIRDTGLGMTTDQQSRLFEAFSQADNSTTRKYGGTGLGLAICKQLVALMDGEISVESKPGEGSCFSFSACFGQHVRIEHDAVDDLLAGKRVLVADDNAVMRTLIAMTVQSFGCHVEAVDSGMAALASMEASLPFDIVLLDWHMQDLDGLETARRARQAGQLAPMVLITGDEPELARDRDPEHWIQAFLAKPVLSDDLREVMNDLLGGASPVRPPMAEESAIPNLSGVRILLVDDNDFNRQVGRELVELTGAKVETADDGAQALQRIANKSFDLILMDLQMPVMDGYTAAREIRERHPELPVLALTAHAIVEERARVLAAGMNDILTKPIAPDTLYSKLTQWLPGKAIGAATVGGNPPPKVSTLVARDLPLAEEETRSNPEVPPDATPVVFDRAAALARVNGDSMMLDRFVGLFRERNARVLDAIGAALRSGDVNVARRNAHALKGGAGTLGMVELQMAAAKLESALASLAPEGAHAKPCDDEFMLVEAAWARAMQAAAAVSDNPG